MSVSRVLGYLKQADNDFNLINDGDKIAVGISGGKDSMILIYVLHLYKKFSKKDYTLVPIHVDEGFPDMDFSEIKAFLNSIDEDLFIEESNPNIYKVLKMHVKNDRLPCSICSKMKKAAINQAAIKYNCNKVAFAHHVDDAIETLFLNEIYGGRVATFTPSTYLSNTNLSLIRPLIYSKEKDIKKAMKEVNLPIVKSTCPNDKKTEREDIKNMLLDIYKKYPKAHDNFKLMLTNLDKLVLWDKINKEDE